MPTITEILKETDLKKVVDKLCVDTIEDRKPEDYLKEYKNERLRRATSVGKREDKKVPIFSETEVDENGDPKKIGDKSIPVAKIATNTPKRIVRTAVAFMVGGEMKLTATDENDGFNEFKRLFSDKLRMHSVIKEFIKTVLIETKAAILFYPVKTEDGTTTIRLKLLNHKSGDFYPHFDGTGDMDAFVRKYTDVIDGKECEIVPVLTSDSIVTITNQGGSLVSKKEPNLAKKITAVYAEIDSPYWDDVAVLMDAKESRLSRLVDGNDYNGEPTKKVFGTADLPSKDTVGKEIHFGMIQDDKGNWVHGDAQYMTNNQSPEPIKLELDILQDEIDTGSATPNLSPSALQGLGNMSTASRKLMFMDAFIRADENLITFQPAITRMINVVIAMMANVTHTKYAKNLTENDISAEFGSIMPEDIAEELENLSKALESNINSQETVTARSPYTKDVAKELAEIKAGKPVQSILTGSIVR